MNKISKKLMVTLSLIFILLVTGCGQTTYTTTDAEKQSNAGRFVGLEEDTTIVTDSETGCKYIYIDSGVVDQRVVSMTPLMKDSKTVECGND